MKIKNIVVYVLTMLLSVLLYSGAYASQGDSNFEFVAEGDISLMAVEQASGYYTYTALNSSEAAITKVNSAISGVISIPSTLGGYKVVEIGSGAFENCNNLTEVTIPSSITTVGVKAFKNCDSLKKVTINGTNLELKGNSTYSAYGVFYGCDLLETVVINSGVKIIGKGAFEGCPSLTNVSMANSVTEMHSYAFNECTALKTITLSNVLQSIESSAFSGCTSLTAISLPGTLTSIGTSAFEDCASLTGLTIPSSVTTVGVKAFKNCDSLKKVTINGTNLELKGNSTYSAYGVFYGCDLLETVVINSGVKIIGKGAFENCKKITTVIMETDVTTIGDSAFGNCESITDVYYGGSKSEWESIEIGKNNDYLLNARIHYNYIVNEKEGARIKSVNLTRNNVTFNILNMRQTFEKGSEDRVTITADVDWGDYQRGKVLLSQNGGKYIETSTNSFGTISPGKIFDSSEMIFVILVDSTGKTLETLPIYLQVTEPIKDNGGTNKHTINIVDAFSFTVSEDKPIIGNQKFKVDLGGVSWEYELDEEEGTFKGVIGFNLEKDENGKFGPNAFVDFKKTFREAKEKAKTGASLAKFYEIMRWNKLGNFAHTFLRDSAKSDFETAICGYVEGKIVDGKPVFTEGGIILKAEIKFSFQGQVFVSVVPVCYSIGAGGEINLEAGVKDIMPGDVILPKWSGDLKIEPFLEISGGIGVVYVGQVGARGKGTLGINISLDHNYQKVDLTGQAYFEIKVLSFKLYEREFAKGTWNIYESNRPSGVSLMSVADSIYDTIDINAVVTPEDRSYASEPTQWLGENQDISLMAVDYTNKQLRVLQTNSYPDVKPILMDCNGTKVMVWLSDDTSRTDVNKTKLVYSVYSNASDTWSSPRAIMDNGTADYYPDAKGGYVVWQKATKIFDNSLSLEEAAKNTDIYIAKFNGTGFDTPVRLTNNSVMDAQPHLAVNGNSVNVVWTQNTENNILGISGKNSIYQMTYENGSWSQQKLLAQNLNTIAHISTGYIENKPAVAYAMDEDNSLATVNDWELYTIIDGSKSRFTNNSEIDSKPVFADINGIPSLLWYSNNNIYYVNDFDTKIMNSVFADGIINLSDDFSVVSNGDNSAILWTSVSDGVAEVHGALYDGVQWSEDITITSESQYARNPHGVIDSDGKLTIVFNRTQNIASGDYFENGRADLCVIDVTPSYDICIKDAFVVDNITSNSDIPVYVTLTNNGELPVDAITVNVLNSSGTKNYTKTFEGKVRPGETKECVVYYKTGSSLNDTNIVLKISSDGINEYNTANNTLNIPLKLTDVEVTDVTVSKATDGYEATIDIQNIGSRSASGVNLEIRKGSETGEVIVNKYIGTLSGNAQKSITVNIVSSLIDGDGPLAVFTAVITTTTDESLLGNNYMSFAVENENKKFTVTYNYTQNGGTSASKSSASVAAGGQADLTVTAQKSVLSMGNDTTAPWEFVGWNTNPDAVSPLYVCTVTEDITLYAIFKRNIVAKFYEGENGELQTQKSITSTIYNNETYAKITLPAIGAYSGWSKDKWRTYTRLSNFLPETSEDYEPQTSFDIYSDANFYATYIRSVTLSYNANGGSGAPQSQSQTQHMYAGRGTDNVSFTVGATPVRSGYIFAGWKTPGGVVYNPGESIKVKENTILSAQWTANQVTKHTVTYNYSHNGGTSADKVSIAVSHGSSADLGTKAYKSGWTFVGWNTDANATTPLSVCTVTGDVTLYAIFKRDIVVKFYEGESGELQTQKTQTSTIYNNATYAKVHLPSAGTYSGWESEKWCAYNSDNSEITHIYYDKMIYQIYDDTELYAIYTRSVTLSYDANGGSGAPQSQSQIQYMYAGHGKEKADFTVAEAPVRSGYIFAGWKTSGGAVYKPGENIKVEDNTILSAQWTANQVTKYTVTYNYSYNGGTSADKKNMSISEGSSADLGVQAYKSGWTFVGWNTNKDARTVLSSYTVNSDVTLYAVYKKTISAKFYYGNTQLQTTLSTIIYNNTTSATFTIPVLNGYTAWTSCGWRGDTSIAAPEYTAGGTVTISSDKNYYGIYSKTINLSYNANGGNVTPAKQSAQIYYNSSGNKQKHTFKLASAITKENYTFGGWAVGSISGSVYEAGSNIELSEDTIVYALWSSNVSWNIDSSGTLTITGKGPMIFDGYTISPWYERRDEVKKIVVDNGITTIFRSAFNSCENATAVQIADTVTTISDYAFSYCDKLERIFIPQNVTFISENALDNCDSMTTIEVSPDNQTYASSDGILFTKDMKSIVKYPCGKDDIMEYTIPATVTIIGNNAFSYNYYLKKVVIPEGVTKIGNFAFYNCWDITEVFVPQSVETIGENIFSMCYDLEKIDVHCDNKNYCSQDGVLFDKEKTVLYQYPCKKSDVQTYVVPDTVKTLKNYSFRGAKSFTGIVIPKSVNTIEYYVFYGCTGLKDVYYCGTQTQWQNTVKVESSGNTPLHNAVMHYDYVLNHTVTYNYSYNGGTSSNKTTDSVSHSARADLSVKSVKSGWEFVGWNTDKDAKEALTECIVQSDITLYAIYKKVLTANFHCAQTLQVVTHTLYNNEQSAEFSLSPEIYEGWIAEGWRKDKKAEPPTVKDSISLFESEDYYAIYSRYIYLEYESNNGIYNIVPNEKQYLNASGEKSGVTFTLGDEPVKHGYIFKGWALGSVNGEIFKAGATVTIKENTIVYAVWEKEVNLYPVFFGVGSDDVNYKVSVRVQGLSEPATVIAALYDYNMNMIGAVTERFVINGTTNLLLKKNSNAYIIKVFVWSNGVKPLTYTGMCGV